MESDSDTWFKLYKRAAEHLHSLSAEEAMESIQSNNFHEAPNWGNYTVKQVLVDLYQRIAELEKKLK